MWREGFRLRSRVLELFHDGTPKERRGVFDGQAAEYALRPWRGGGSGTEEEEDVNRGE